MNECIEIEHSDDYRQGYDDGIESFRPMFDQAVGQLKGENMALYDLIYRIRKAIGDHGQMMQEELVEAIGAMKHNVEAQEIMLQELQASKTCEGCRWNDLGDTGYKPQHYPCRSCIANKHFEYRYEPKDKP